MLDKFLLWILFTGPEGVLMIYAGLSFLGIERPWKKIILSGFLFGLITVLSRIILPGGYHIFVTLLAYCLLLIFIFNVSIKTSIIACFITSLMINLGQATCGLLVLRHYGLSFADVLKDIWLHIVFGWLGDLILLIGAIIMFFKKTPILIMPESKFNK